MCGRFSLFDMLGLKVRFNLDLPDFISPRYNIAPTIITTSANTLLEPIHKRMPVILDREKEEAWLDPETDNETFKSILKPYLAELMKSYEVSTAVNSPRNDVPEVVKPV